MQPSLRTTHTHTPTHPPRASIYTYTQQGIRLAAHPSLLKRHWFRNFLMWGFHHLVALLCVRGIRDTQCGFKMFTRKTAAFLFPNMHIERWAFDVEILFLAQWQDT